MPSLIERLRPRSGEGLSPPDLDRLSALAADERSKLAALVADAGATIESLAGARAALQGHSRELAAVDDKVRGVREWLDHFENRTQSMVADYRGLTRTAEGLATQVARFEETAGAITRDLFQVREMAGGMDDLLSGLGAARNLARKSEEQLHRLNALSEHVAQKSQALAATQQALERAEAQSRQTTDLVRAIEARVEKVAEENRLLRSSADRLDELSALHRDLVERLDAAGRQREAIRRESDEFETKITAAATRVDEGLARSEMLGEQVDLANERVRELAAALGRQQQQLDELAAREQEFAQGQRHADALLARLGEFESRVGELEQRSTALAAFDGRLAEVAAAAARLDDQMRTIAERRSAVDEVGSRLAELSAIHERTRERLGSLEEGRQEIERATAFLADFRRTRGEAEGRIQEIAKRLDDVDRVHAHLLKLRQLTDELAGRSAELEPRLDFVTGVESRLNRLDGLSQAVDARLGAQLAREGDLESMKLAQGALEEQMTDLKSLAVSLQNSPQLKAMEGRLEELERRLEVAGRMLERNEVLEGALADGEGRVEALGERAASLEERIGRHQERLDSLADEGRRAHRVRQAWEAEAQALAERQQELRKDSKTLAGEIERAREIHSDLASRGEALREREAVITRYEGKIRELEAGVAALEGKIDQVTSRQTLVDRIKRDVDGIYATCDESRRDAAEVIAARKEIAAAGRQMERLGTQAAEFEGKLTRLRAKIEGVEETEYKIDALSNILDDLTVNLETFREQKSVIDHVAAKLSQIDFEIKRAELVTQSLRDERQLADRIQQGIKALRGGRAKGAGLALVKPPETDADAEGEGNTAADDGPRAHDAG